MEITTKPIKELFYLFCALSYNRNESLNHTDKTKDLREQINKVLSDNNTFKFKMGSHRYQYHLSVLNSPNYVPTVAANPNHYHVLQYIKAISEISELDALWKDQESIMEEQLASYGDTIKNIKKLYKDNFAFEPKIKKFVLTRNYDKSGMMIPTKDVNYIVVGYNNSDKPNERNLLHETLHAYVDMADLPPPENLESMWNKVPEKLRKNYNNQKTYVYECLVRALVAHLTKNADYLEDQRLSEDDKALVLTEKFLKALEDSKKPFTVDYFNTLPKQL